jgi:cytosine/adenosine deaminase-related metal-dependent hydrolase
MLTSIKNGMVLTLDPENWLLSRADVLIEDGLIRAVGQDLSEFERVDRVVDAADQLVMPGWVNADLHASEALFKGQYENTPLDQRPLYTHLAGCENPELVYACALFSGLAMLKSGVTTVQDHWLFPLASSLKQVEAAVMAYQSLGLRTTLALGSCEGFFEQRFADMLEELPPSLKERIGGDSVEAHKVMDAYKQAVELWHDRADGLLRLTLAPDLALLQDAQRLEDLRTLASQHNLGLHFHFAETKLQALNRLNGKSFIQAADEMGLIGESTSISQAVWITPAEMDLLAERGASFIHTPLSDFYSGSGILPVHQLTERGVRTALGFGAGSGGVASFFDALKMTASIQRIVQPDYAKWPAVRQILEMGTHAGAQASLWGEQVGRIAAGWQADLAFYDLKQLAFTPLNELEYQLIYLEDGSSLQALMINGRFVMENGHVTSVNEQEVLERFTQAQTAYDQARKTWDLDESQLLPYQQAAYRRASAQPFDVHRWANQAPLPSRLEETFPQEGENNVNPD